MRKRKWALLLGVSLAGGVIGAVLSSLTGNVLNVRNWDSGWFQAGGSLLAVSVALFYPLIERFKKFHNMKRVLEIELKENVECVQDILSQGDGKHPDSAFLPAGFLKSEKTKSISLECWHQYRYEIAPVNALYFEKMKNINRHLEALIGLREQRTDVQVFLIDENARKVLRIYKEYFSRS